MNNSQRILDEVSRTGIALLLREPFYAHLLASVNKEVVGKGHPVDTMAVGLSGATSLSLYVNADFWDAQLTNPDYRYGVLKHEMLHLIFRHLFINEPNLDSFLLNVAFDLVVNQYIERHLLPGDSIFLESFPDLQLLPGQTWYYYYQKIQQQQEGKGGEAAGTPTNEQLQKIRSDSCGLERHEPWQEIRNRSELEKNVLETYLDSLMRTAHQRTSAHAWGNMPGDIRQLLQQGLERPTSQLDWRSILKIFAGSAGRTRLQNTIHRPSKRYGTTPGIKIRRRPRFFVAIDTSGSIGQAELNLFFNEVYHLWRSCATIEILECDTKINRSYPYHGSTPDAVEGRGGTSFREPLERALRERPDGLIYFTDGYADTPEVKTTVPVLWLITQRGLDMSHPSWGRLPGRKVKMRE